MAAFEGHEGALFHLGVFYEKGRGVQKDFRLAVHFYRLPSYGIMSLRNIAQR